MTPVRAVASALAALAVLAASLAPAMAQTGGPIPYTALVKREHAGSSAPRRPRPRPHAAPRPPSITAGAVANSPASASSSAPVAPPAAPTRGATAAAKPAAPPQPPKPDLPASAASPAVSQPAGARLAPGAPLSAGELESFIDGAVRQAASDRPLAGVAVSVVQDGAVVLEKGYGFARRSPATPVDPARTLFRLGSVSKVFTWIEVLKAVEAGRLRLDEPVNTHLPPALRIPDDGFREPIRLRNLMTHDAGFEARELGRLFLADPDEVRPLEQTLDRQRPRRVRPPGEFPTYSSYGAALAGFMAADLAKTPFEALVERDLFQPMGLASTTFREPGAEREGFAPMPAELEGRLAEGFAWRQGGLQRQPFGFAGGLAPALSASSTADDMARLMAALLNGGHAAGGGGLWGPRTDAALRTPLSPGWSHGLMMFDLPGGFQGFGHEGATPAFRAKLLIAPQLRLGVFVAANSDTGERLVHALPELIVRRFYAGPPPLAPAAGAFDPAAYSGAYVSTRRTYHGLEGFVGRLTRLYTVRPEGAGVLAVFGPEGGRRWLASGEPGRFVAADGASPPLAFRLDPHGRARAFLDPGGMWGAERVDALHRPEVLAAVAGGAELAALLALAGLFVRDAREYRQSRGQTTASRLQSLAALLWVGALGAFLVFALRATEAAQLLGPWPDPWLVGASSAALAAALLTLAQLVQLPAAWRSDRRVQGWNTGRKLRHTCTVLLFSAFAFVLLGWGALEPWSS